MFRQQQQDIDLWEAWIDFDHVHPNYFGMLYVIGDVVSRRRPEEPILCKRRQQAPPGRVLMLEILSEDESLPGRITEAVYAEPITNIDQYTSIEVYAGTKLIATLRDIEILI